MRHVWKASLFKWVYTGLVFLAVLLVYALPQRPLFNTSYSTVLECRDGQLLSAIIADDMQWRFPSRDRVPEKFSLCIRTYEDRYFFLHPGVNPISVYRALWQNITSGRRVSGASTLSMQTVRLSQMNKPRTLFRKFTETVRALWLEQRYSKDEILAMYTAHAPFGGNVVGLDAAAWRYYQRPAGELSWAESATLAVLPNAPALIFPGKNKELLLKKRNHLLERLHNRGHLDSMSYALALKEPLPGKPYPLPQQAMHLLNRAVRDGHKGERLTTTLDYHLQQQVTQVALHHHTRLLNNHIKNIAIVILDNRNNEVLAYLGNIESPLIGCNNHAVDIALARRSSGSILKPFLYAVMLEQGELLPHSLVPDVPALYGNYRPANFTRRFSGAVEASRALSRSLNVPSVHMLHRYGVARFHDNLKSLGLSTIDRSPAHYGLSIILGGSEVTLWELTYAYSRVSRLLLASADDLELQGPAGAAPAYLLNKREQPFSGGRTLPFGAGAAWHMVEAIRKTNRPEFSTGWKHFYSSPQVAWKTGTSHGNRDAWAVGITPQYTIGVWTGNAQGEGRPQLTGIEASAPVLFHLFELIKPQGWFQKPEKELKPITVCQRSGYKNAALCPQTTTIMAPPKAISSPQCPYHQLIHLDSSKQYQVTTACEEVHNMVREVRFVLPPLMEKYYRYTDPRYKTLPPYKEGCLPRDKSVLHIIYPEPNARIFLPRDITARENKLVMEAVHRSPKQTLYWFLNGQFITETTDNHQVNIAPPSGNHTLFVTDKDGNTHSRNFSIHRSPSR